MKERKYVTVQIRLLQYEFNQCQDDAEEDNLFRESLQSKGIGGQFIKATRVLSPMDALGRNYLFDVVIKLPKFPLRKYSKSMLIKQRLRRIEKQMDGNES